MRNGLRRIPIILEFNEVEKISASQYRPPHRLTSNPVVKIVFKDKSGNQVGEEIATVKDGKVQIRPNPTASSLFIQGSGTIEVSTPKEYNVKSNGKKFQPYNNVEKSISELKIPDYMIVRFSVTMTEK